MSKNRPSTVQTRQVLDSSTVRASASTGPAMEYTVANGARSAGESTGAQRTAETNEEWQHESSQSDIRSGTTLTSTTDLDNMDLDSISEGLPRSCKQEPDTVTNQGCALCAQHCTEFTMISSGNGDDLVARVRLPGMWWPWL